MKIIFKDEAHKEFFQKAEKLCREWDNFHQALFYILGLSPDCRKHINDLFEFDSQKVNYGIKPKTAFNHGWQTSGSMAVTRMGFNLFNGYKDKETSPYFLCSSTDTPYFWEGVKLLNPSVFMNNFCQIESEDGSIVEDDIPVSFAEDYIKDYEKEYGVKFRIKTKTEISMEI